MPHTSSKLRELLLGSSTSLPVPTSQREDTVELGTHMPLVTSSPEHDCAEYKKWHILSLSEVSDDYLDEKYPKQSEIGLSNNPPPTDGITGEMRLLQTKTSSGDQPEVKSRSRDVNKSSRNRTRTNTSLPTKSASGATTFPTPLRSKGQLPAQVLRTPVKQANVSIIKEDEKTNNPQLKQDVLLDPELVGNVLQRELARLNLNVLRNMAGMLDEQEQKFAAERNTLRASGRMLRAEMRRAVSETIKINSERQKLDLERDVLQSQLLARRRSARLLDLMIQDFEHGRERTASDINRLYTYSRLQGSSPAGRDLGEQLEYETDMLDQQRLYIQSLLWPRWQRLPEKPGSIIQGYPMQLTAMNSLSIPSLHVDTDRTYVNEEMPAWDMEWAEISRRPMDGVAVSRVTPDVLRDDPVTSISLLDGWRPEHREERLSSQLYSVLTGRQAELQ
jgi:hypothetical protein